MNLNKKRTLFIGLIASISLVCLTSVYVASISLSGFSNWIAPPEGCVQSHSMEQVEQTGQFLFPTSAQDVNIFSERSPQNCFIYISFRISSIEIDTFLTATYVRTLSLSKLPSEFANLPIFIDWPLDMSKEYLSGTGRGPNVISHAIAVDTDNTESIVYLVIFL